MDWIFHKHNYMSRVLGLLLGILVVALA